MTLAEKYALVYTDGVTLDGKRAKICGARNDFATVRNDRYGVEFAWPTVARIVARGGAFTS